MGRESDVGGIFEGRAGFSRETLLWSGGQGVFIPSRFQVFGLPMVEPGLNPAWTLSVEAVLSLLSTFISSSEMKDSSLGDS